jgi:hypothetical protein
MIAGVQQMIRSLSCQLVLGSQIVSNKNQPIVILFSRRCPLSLVLV